MQGVHMSFEPEYAPGLPPPQPLRFLNLNSPSALTALRLVLPGLKRETRSWKPGAGVKMKVMEMAGVECFCLEPAGKVRGSMLYLHGGAFCLPVQRSSLALAAEYCRALKLRVCLPEYGLLPEHPAPEAFMEIAAVYGELCPELLYGESAGAALALGTAIAAADRGTWRARGMCLIYPALDDRAHGTLGGCAIDRETVNGMWQRYLARADADMLAMLVPARAKSLDGLPNTYIELAEHDCLRDEGLEMAERLKASGNRVRLEIRAGAYHGFDSHLETPYVFRTVQARAGIMEEMLERSVTRQQIREQNDK